MKAKQNGQQKKELAFYSPYPVLFVNPILQKVCDFLSQSEWDYQEIIQPESGYESNGRKFSTL